MIKYAITIALALAGAHCAGAVPAPAGNPGDEVRTFGNSASIQLSQADQVFVVQRIKSFASLTGLNLQVRIWDSARNYRLFSRKADASSAYGKDLIVGYLSVRGGKPRVTVKAWTAYDPQALELALTGAEAKLDPAQSMSANVRAHVKKLLEELEARTTRPSAATPGAGVLVERLPVDVAEGFHLGVTKVAVDSLYEIAADYDAWVAARRRGHATPRALAQKNVLGLRMKRAFDAIAADQGQLPSNVTDYHRFAYKGGRWAPTYYIGTESEASMHVRDYLFRHLQPLGGAAFVDNVAAYGGPNQQAAAKTYYTLRGEAGRLTKLAEAHSYRLDVVAQASLTGTAQIPFLIASELGVNADLVKITYTNGLLPKLNYTADLACIGLSANQSNGTTSLTPQQLYAPLAALRKDGLMSVAKAVQGLADNVDDVIRAQKTWGQVKQFKNLLRLFPLQPGGGVLFDADQSDNLNSGSSTIPQYVPLETVMPYHVYGSGNSVGAVVYSGGTASERFFLGELPYKTIPFNTSGESETWGVSTDLGSVSTSASDTYQEAGYCFEVGSGSNYASVRPALSKAGKRPPSRTSARLSPLTVLLPLSATAAEVETYLREADGLAAAISRACPTCAVGAAVSILVATTDAGAPKCPSSAVYTGASCDAKAAADARAGALATAAAKFANVSDGQIAYITFADLETLGRSTGDPDYSMASADNYARVLIAVRVDQPLLDAGQ